MCNIFNGWMIFTSGLELCYTHQVCTLHTITCLIKNDFQVFKKNAHLYFDVLLRLPGNDGQKKLLWENAFTTCAKILIEMIIFLFFFQITFYMLVCLTFEKMRALWRPSNRSNWRKPAQVWGAGAGIEPYTSARWGRHANQSPTVSPYLYIS